MTLAESHPADVPSVPTDAPAAAPGLRQRGRRWFQFRLRTLMVLMLLVSIPLAALAWRFQRARTQAVAVATIRKLGGNVIYDYDFSRDPAGRLLVGNGDSEISGWLKRICGQDFFQTARGVATPDHNPISDSDAIEFWLAVEKLPQLELVHAEGRWIERNAASAALRDKTELYYLELRSCTIGDDDVDFIGNLRRLYVLDLNGSQITDQGVRFLTVLPRLEIADLRGTKISRRGIDELKHACPAVVFAHD